MQSSRPGVGGYFIFTLYRPRFYRFWKFYGVKFEMNTTTDRQPTEPTVSIFPFDPMQFPATDAVSTAEQQLETASQAPVRGRPFKKGQSGNPKGRPKGSRNRLTDSVLRKIASDFATNGDEILERVRKEEPALYLKFIISLLPRELIMQFEQHRPSEAGTLEYEDVIELAECGERQTLVEQVYRNQPPQVSRR